MVETYRQRNSDVQAVKYEGDNLEEIVNFTQGRVNGTFKTDKGQRGFRLNTAYGLQMVYPGDYVVNTFNKGFIAMKPDRFNELYVPVIKKNKKKFDSTSK